MVSPLLLKSTLNMNTNSYPIYVISLKRTPERRLHMQRQLDALNLDYQFVDAIDIYDLKSPEYQAEVFDLLGIDGYITEFSEYINKEITVAACTFSHMKAHKLMMRNNHSAACVLEDDAQISPNFAQILRAAQKKSWDILMLSNRSIAVLTILREHLSIQKSKTQFPEIDCSLYPGLRKIKFFRRLLLSTPTVCSVGWTVIPKLQWYWLKLSSQSIFNKLFRYSINTKGLPTPAYIACKVGGLPVGSSQQALYKNYNIAIPAEKPTSGMAYLLTADTSNKYKDNFSRMITNGEIVAADNFRRLYDIKLRILTPPCAIASLVYLKYSSRNYMLKG